jgi:hypothetical protein
MTRATPASAANKFSKVRAGIQGPRWWCGPRRPRLQGWPAAPEGLGRKTVRRRAVIRLVVGLPSWVAATSLCATLPHASSSQSKQLQSTLYERLARERRLPVCVV